MAFWISSFVICLFKNLLVFQKCISLFCWLLGDHYIFWILILFQLYLILKILKIIFPLWLFMLLSGVFWWRSSSYKMNKFSLFLYRLTFFVSYLVTPSLLQYYKANFSFAFEKFHSFALNICPLSTWSSYLCMTWGREWAKFKNYVLHILFAYC